MAAADKLKKLKGKMPPPPSKDGEGADPMLEIPDEEEGAGDGDVDNMSRNDSPDADSDAKTIARGKDGDLSEEGPEEEGTPDHEEREGPAEKAEERKHLKDVSSDDLLKELKRRGHPGGENSNKSEGVDEEPSDDEDSYQS